MAKKVRVVLNRKAFGTEVLHKAVKPVMDDVQEQVEGMGGGGSGDQGVPQRGH